MTAVQENAETETESFSYADILNVVIIYNNDDTGM